MNTYFFQALAQVHIEAKSDIQEIRVAGSPRRVAKKLREMVGVEKGGRQEVWRTSGGRTVEMPRHLRDLGRSSRRHLIRP